jgi:undecaprenyl-diphosphatase
MLEWLQHIDTQLFRFGNWSLRNPVFDVVMPFLTDLTRQPAAIALTVALLLWMIVRGSRPVRIAALLLIPTILLSDQLSSSVIKALVDRPRPCHLLANVRLLVDCGAGLSFPSSHAVNHFAAALVLSYFLPRGTWWFFGYASLAAFTRVYVGVHYPLDVIGGAVVGVACGAVVLGGFHGIERWNERRKMRRSTESKR